LFHSGILWNGEPSSKYNRPAEFEPLFHIEGLKFALAHVSWPWCDECIAVYGKFLNSPNATAEMFIDITPGTPAVYREETLRKLFLVGYNVSSNIIFGTDNLANDYNSDWALEWIERDNQIYRNLAIGEETINNIYAANLMRFLGIK